MTASGRRSFSMGSRHCGSAPGQRYRNMFMDRLALVVVLCVQLTVGAGDGLSCLVGLETQVADLVFARLLFVSQAGVTQHEVVVSLQILWIDTQHRHQLSDCVLLAP